MIIGTWPGSGLGTSRTGACLIPVPSSRFPGMKQRILCTLSHQIALLNKETRPTIL